MRLRVLSGLLSSLFLVPVLLSAQGTQTNSPDSKFLWEFDSGG
jgi:hypothetical protein